MASQQQNGNVDGSNHLRNDDKVAVNFIYHCVNNGASK